MSTGPIGPMTSVNDVCEAVLATLRNPATEGSDYPLLAHYLAEKERQEGLAAHSLPLPRTWAVDVGDDVPPEHELPRVVVYSGGLASPPTKRADGFYEMTWNIGVGVVLRGGSRDETRRRVAAYVAALRACVLANGPDDMDAWVEWVDEAYDTADAENRRTLGAGEDAFEVTIVGAVTRGRPDYNDLPIDPYEPPGSTPQVSSVDVDYEVKRLDESL